jgi:hypothetical protein
VPSFDDLDLVGDARPMALKKAWLDPDAPTEKELQNVIFADIESFTDDLKTENEPV